MISKTISVVLGSLLLAPLLMTAPLTATANADAEAKIAKLRQKASDDIKGIEVNLERKIKRIRDEAKIDDAKKHAEKARHADIPDNATLKKRVEKAIHGYSHVAVSAHNGKVELTGLVKTQKERNMVLDLVSGVQGVQSIDDDLRIENEPSQSVEGYIDDATITAHIKSKILAQKGLDSLDISVDTDRGAVTLSGEVEIKSQISLAEKLAREVKGVHKVINNLTVTK